MIRYPLFRFLLSRWTTNNQVVEVYMWTIVWKQFNQQYVLRFVFFWNMGLSEKGRSKVKAQQPNTAINWYGGDEPPYVTIKTWIYRAKLGYPDAPWCWYVYLHLDDVWGKCWYIFHICGSYGIGCHTSVWIVYVNASSPLKLESLVKVRWRSERLCFTMNHVSFQQDWIFHLKPQIKPPKKGDIVI